MAPGGQNGAHMKTESKSIDLKLSQDEAFVLFEWLASGDENGGRAMIGSAEERVLWRIEAQLESRLVEPFDPDYENLVAGARQRLLGEEGDQD